jgi:hypothetical protein
LTARLSTLKSLGDGATLAWAGGDMIVTFPSEQAANSTEISSKAPAIIIIFKLSFIDSLH